MYGIQHIIQSISLLKIFKKFFSSIVFSYSIIDFNLGTFIVISSNVSIIADFVLLIFITVSKSGLNIVFSYIVDNLGDKLVCAFI